MKKCQQLFVDAVFWRNFCEIDFDEITHPEHVCLYSLTDCQDAIFFKRLQKGRNREVIGLDTWILNRSIVLALLSSDFKPSKMHEIHHTTCFHYRVTKPKWDKFNLWYWTVKTIFLNFFFPCLLVSGEATNYSKADFLYSTMRKLFWPSHNACKSDVSRSKLTNRGMNSIVPPKPVLSLKSSLTGGHLIIQVIAGDEVVMSLRQLQLVISEKSYFSQFGFVRFVTLYIFHIIKTIGVRQW